MIESGASVWGAWLAAWTLGLFSSAHCIGMCGGIMGALSAAIPADARGRRWQLLIGYNLGRISSYTLMGLVAGLLAGGLAPLDPILRLLAGCLLIAMGLYLAGWWRGLTWLERGGAILWRRIQPLSKGLLPVRRAPQALLLGALWGWLPCGLVYTALAYALAQGDMWVSGGTMLAFGLGTLPAVLAAGVMAQGLTRLLQRRGLRVVLALAVILFGVWTLWPALGGAHSHSEQDSSSHHHHH